MTFSNNVLCKWFGPRSGPAKCWAWSRSKLFSILMVFLKDFFFKKKSGNYQQETKNMQKFPSTQIVNPIALLPGREAQSVTCLITDARLTADPGFANSIPAWSHTLVEIDHEIISTVILLPSLIHSRRVVIIYKWKYVYNLLVNCLFKLAQEKLWFGELTVPPWP